MKSHPYPLPACALDEFIHPHPDHMFGSVYRHAGELLAGNGYVAIRAARGRWIEAEYPATDPKFLKRILSLPWEKPLCGPWRDLQAGMAANTRLAPIAPWRGVHVAFSPVWRVCDVVVRLSWLQLIARLPRCEVFAGPHDAGDPLFFRFSGGRGMIAHDPSLTRWSYHLFPPVHDCLTGERVASASAPRPTFALPGWPPQECPE